MMRRLASFVMVAGVLAAQDTTPAPGVNFYSLEKERSLGQQLANEYRKGVQTIEDAAVKAYLEEVGQRLAKTQGPAITYTFELVDDERAVLHEPPAFPGGAVFIPASLILAAKSEDELAGMLAHAIAHIAARHGTKEMTKAEIVNQAMVPLIYMGGWSGYAMRQGAAQAIPLGFVKFHQQLELQADALAAPAMAAAGYDPRALTTYIERVQPEDVLPASPMNPFPGRDVRVAALQTAIAGVPAVTYPAHDGFAAIQQAVSRLNVKPARVPPRLAR